MGKTEEAAQMINKLRQRPGTIRKGYTTEMTVTSNDINIDFILDDITKIRFILRSCDSSEEYEEVIDISEIPFREGKTTRVSVSVSFADSDKCNITIKDLGFGEFVKSSGKVISKELVLRS